MLEGKSSGSPLATTLTVPLGDTPAIVSWRLIATYAFPRTSIATPSGLPPRVVTTCRLLGSHVGIDRTVRRSVFVTVRRPFRNAIPFAPSGTPSCRLPSPVSVGFCSQIAALPPHGLRQIAPAAESV